MKPSLLVSVALVSLIAGFGGGYFYGAWSEQAASRLAVSDGLASKTLIGIRRDITLLADIRGGRSNIDLVRDSEMWTVLQLHQIDPATFLKGSASDFIYPKTMEMLAAYRKQYPDSAINPEKDPAVARALGLVKQ